MYLITHVRYIWSHMSDTCPRTQYQVQLLHSRYIYRTVDVHTTESMNITHIRCMCICIYHYTHQIHVPAYTTYQIHISHRRYMYCIADTHTSVSDMWSDTGTHVSYVLTHVSDMWSDTCTHVSFVWTHVSDMCICYLWYVYLLSDHTHQMHVSHIKDTCVHVSDQISDTHTRTCTETHECTCKYIYIVREGTGACVWFGVCVRIMARVCTHMFKLESVGD